MKLKGFGYRMVAGGINRMVGPPSSSEIELRRMKDGHCQSRSDSIS
jgi:hypothetical protein